MRSLFFLFIFGVMFTQGIIPAIAQVISPEQRRINERAKALKDLNASYCSTYPQTLRQECQTAFLNEVKRNLPKEAKKFVADALAQADAKVNAEINEENQVAKYSALLSDIGIGNGDCTTSKCLKDRYSDYLISIQPEPTPDPPAPIETATGS